MRWTTRGGASCGSSLLIKKYTPSEEILIDVVASQKLVPSASAPRTVTDNLLANLRALRRSTLLISRHLVFLTYRTSIHIS